MSLPHNKKYASLSVVKAEHNEYLKLLKSILPVGTVKDDMRHISIKDLNDFIIRVNYWNLDENNRTIDKIGVFSTYNKSQKTTTTALIPLDEDGETVMGGPGGPADGPSYIN